MNASREKICSLHFPEEAYHRDLRGELMGIPTPKHLRLKATAVPSQNLCPVNRSRVNTTGKQPLKGTSDRTTRFLNRERKIIVAECLSLENSVNEEEKVGNNSAFIGPQLPTAVDFLKVYERLEAAEEKVRVLKEKIAAVNRKSIAQKAAETRRKNFQKLHDIANKKKVANLSTAVRKIFSDSQMKRVTGVCRAKWSEDDILFGLKVKAISSKAYDFLRKLGYPIPSPTSLKEWTSHFSCRPGFLEPVFKVLAAKAVSMDASERDVVLMFDEMKVDDQICYDQPSDKFYGPCKQLQVIMIRSVTMKWKQIIFYAFDQKLTDELFHMTIKKLHEAEFCVRCVVSDLGGGNRGLHNSLGVNVEKPWIWHPILKDQKIHFMADVPHLIKLLRNHLVDHGFSLPGGHKINVGHLLRIAEEDRGEIKILPNVSREKILVANERRMNVENATSVISVEMAAAATHLFGESMAGVADFLQTFGEFFKLWSSRVPVDQKTI